MCQTSQQNVEHVETTLGSCRSHLGTTRNVRAASRREHAKRRGGAARDRMFHDKLCGPLKSERREYPHDV
eukprot:4195913-Pyramimonas_sp.AAC.1